MNIRNIVIASFLIFSITNYSALSADEGESQPAAEAATSIDPKGKQKVMEVQFEASLADAHAAAMSAMKLHGFTIKASEATKLEGSHPRNFGAVVGSGGEKLTIWLTSEGEALTSVKVKTKRTMLGRVGQKRWTAPVMAAIERALN